MSKSYMKNAKIDVSIILNDAKEQWSVVNSLSGIGKRLMVVTEYAWKLHSFVLSEEKYEDTRRIVLRNFLREYDDSAEALRSKYDHWLLVIGYNEVEEFNEIAKVLNNEKIARKNIAKSVPVLNIIHLVVLPSKNAYFLHKLKLMDMLDETFLKIHNVELLIPYDSDVISLELHNAYRDIYVREDESFIYKIARDLLKLEKLYGFLPQFFGKGNYVDKIVNILKRLECETLSEVEEDDSGTKTMEKNQSCFDYVILIDRGIDLISPLVTQLTYEGLISTLFEVTDTVMEFPSPKFIDCLSGSAMDSRTIYLNSGDKLFEEIRDRHFNAVGKVLVKRAHELSGKLDEKKDDMTVEEMRGFVDRLPNLLAEKKSLSLHTNIAEQIKKITDSDDFLNEISLEQEFLNLIENDRVSVYIEDMIARQRPLVSVLRLISVQSLVSSGLKPRILEHYKWELFRGYGLQGTEAMILFEKAGLISTHQSPRTYITIRKALKLTMEDTSDINPTDIGYVHGAYAPISVRVVEQIVQNRSIKGALDTLSLIPADSLDQMSIFIKNRTQSQSIGLSPSSSLLNLLNHGQKQSMVLVVYVGGCTFAEISALRFLAQQEDNNVEFVIMTTEVINSNSFLNSIIKNH